MQVWISKTQKEYLKLLELLRGAIVWLNTDYVRNQLPYAIIPACDYRSNAKLQVSSYGWVSIQMNTDAGVVAQSSAKAQAKVHEWLHQAEEHIVAGVRVSATLLR